VICVCVAQYLKHPYVPLNYSYQNYYYDISYYNNTQDVLHDNSNVMLYKLYLNDCIHINNVSITILIWNNQIIYLILPIDYYLLLRLL